MGGATGKDRKQKTNNPRCGEVVRDLFRVSVAQIPAVLPAAVKNPLDTGFYWINHLQQEFGIQRNQRNIL